MNSEKFEIFKNYIYEIRPMLFSNGYDVDESSISFNDDNTLYSTYFCETNTESNKIVITYEFETKMFIIDQFIDNKTFIPSYYIDTSESNYVDLPSALSEYFDLQNEIFNQFYASN